MLLLTENILKALKSLENLIIFGFPSYEVIKNLILKRGFISKEGTVAPINSNKIIEENLGNLGMLCVEDIVSELYH